jgi:hypothetical protein
MMIRPWYRSLLFWLGLPGLLFLLWAWGSSNSVHRTLFPSKSSHLNTAQGKVLWFSGQSDIGHDFTFDFRTGEVAVCEIVVPPGMLRTITHFKPWAVSRRKVPAEDQVWFAPPRWQARDINHDTRFRLVVVPYWLLTGGYAGLWLGCVGWNQRRKARLLKLHAAPPP